MSSNGKIVRDGGFSKRAHAITSDVSAERQARLLWLRSWRAISTMVARHSEYSTRMENDRGRGRKLRTRSDKRGRVTGRLRERRETKKRTRRMARCMGETFTLRPKMKIVLLDALRRGQRTRHIISALASVAKRYEDRGQLFLSQ